MLRATPTLAAALALALAGAAASRPARAFGEASRQVLIDATFVAVELNDQIVFDLGAFKPGQRLDPTTEATLSALASDASAANASAIGALQGDPLVGTQDGAVALVALSIAASESQRLSDLLAEPGEPKAGKVEKPARLARSLQRAAVVALQGRPTRFRVNGSLERAIGDFWDESGDVLQRYLANGLPDDRGALVEPFSGGPKGHLVEDAALVPGPGMRAKVKKDELELSADGKGPVSAGIDLNVPLGPSYTALVTLKLSPKLSTKQRAGLDGFSAGLQVATDASADPAELFVVEHQTTPDGWVQSFIASKTGVLDTFPHASADPLREITSFAVKDGNVLTIGALLTDASGQTKVEHTNIPVVGDLPVLGLYFRNNDKVKLLADDLIIFSTPHLVNEAGGQ